MERLGRRESGSPAVVGPPRGDIRPRSRCRASIGPGMMPMESDLPDAKTLYDAFICHASEDKDAFVRPLAEALRSHHLQVWYDEFALDVGDNLREAIDKGLTASRYGIVVLSPSFFRKRWPNRELNGLVARETAEDRGMILPVWHDVDQDEVMTFSPPLADLRAVVSADGLSAVVEQLLKKLRPERSPLVVARDILIEKGISPPIVTDEWWLDIVEIKEAELRFPDLNIGWRWIFPLPFPSESRGEERGANIAWTALQLDWANDAKDRKICQLTYPETVHGYLREWPGLLECARRNPATLALYAPQLTIPGFDDGFADVFDELMSQERLSNGEAFRYGSAETVDGNPPLCGDFVAWRHPIYGNYTPGELSYEFVTAHNGSYSREVFDGFECLIWLLCDESSWVPEELRETLKQGFRERVHWWVTQFSYSSGIVTELYERTKSTFRYTKTLRAELVGFCVHALQKLDISEDADKVVSRFIEGGFVEGYYEEERIREARKKQRSAR